MKKFYTLFIVLFGSIIFGQEYRAMLGENHVWYVSHYLGEGNFAHNQYRLSDENLSFNGKEYTKMDITNNSWLEVYLHENIAEKKVYVYYPEAGEEYLLYDFNLEVGDSLPLNGYHNFEGFEEAVIESITYESIFGFDNIKTYHTGSIKIYEGIGADSGLFTLIGSIDDMYTLTDFYQEEEIYEPLLNTQNRWVVHYSVTNGDGGGGAFLHEYRISNSSTIIINDKEYSRIEFRYNPNVFGGNNWSVWDNYNPPIYLSENIEEKKVYIYNHETNQEHLLYNFNLSVGDEVSTSGFLPLNDEYDQFITNINEEDIFGLNGVMTYHLRWNDMKIYTGIGSNSGLFTYDEFENRARLENFYRSTMNTSEENSKIKTLIYPIPFSDKIQVQNSEEIIELQLFDLQGKLISINKNLEELNSKLSSLNNAVYFLKIQFKNNQSETIKLIKK